MGMDSELTIVVPIRNQASLLKGFLRDGVPAGNFNLLFADGSTNDKVERYLKRNPALNAQYIRFPPDISWAAYLKKLAEASAMVRTRFAMLADPDDYVLPRGVREALALLSNDATISCAGSGLSVRQAWHWAKRWEDIGRWQLSTLSFESAEEAIRVQVETLGGLPLTFYNVHRTDALVRATEKLAALCPGRPFVDQYFSLCSMCEGYIGATEFPSYVHALSQFTPPAARVPYFPESSNTSAEAVESWYEGFRYLGFSVMGSWPEWAEHWAMDLRNKPRLLASPRNRMHKMLSRIPGTSDSKERTLNWVTAELLPVLDAYGRLFSPETLRLIRVGKRDILE
ncbi:MAG: hypothetical protein JW395_0836 [Nitrospira sp.]|nr:hypothetical protein [Nitrospira sp.]